MAAAPEAGRHAASIRFRFFVAAQSNLPGDPRSKMSMQSTSETTTNTDVATLPHRSTAARRAWLVAAALVSLAACTSTPPSRGPHPAPPAPPPSSSSSSAAPAPAPAPAPPALFARPAEGDVVGRFDGKRNKGIDFAGNAGDPVRAAADGRVVFVGGQLRGYGNMVIVKHSDTYLTAYAHNQKILVKEKDLVQRGQPIAEMGRSGTDRVKLHFEIRKQGVAVDPQPYLDGRAR